jgi:hypothetical protein
VKPSHPPLRTVCSNDLRPSIPVHAHSHSDATNGSFLLRGFDLQRDPLDKTRCSLIHTLSVLLARQHHAGFLSFVCDEATLQRTCRRNGQAKRRKIKKMDNYRASRVNLSNKVLGYLVSGVHGARLFCGVPIKLVCR